MPANLCRIESMFYTRCWLSLTFDIETMGYILIMILKYCDVDGVYLQSKLSNVVTTSNIALDRTTSNIIHKLTFLLYKKYAF